MIKNYFRITYRNLLKQRSYTLINLLGLGIGLACTMLLALWIQRELSVNQFHEHQSELFRIMENQTYGDDIMTFGSTPGPLAATLKADHLEITHVTRMTWGNRKMISRNNEGFYERGYYVDTDFLNMFSFPVVQGDTKTVLTQPQNILITEKLVEKYFANENPIGQILTLDNSEEFTVTGVLKDVPKASTIRFDFLLPMENFVAKNDYMLDWGNNTVQTYFRTVPGASASQISQKIASLVADKGSTHIELLAHPLKDWYLRNSFMDGKNVGGYIERIRLFGVIAIFILLIAGINFMNLVTAKSATRAKEVGVRKVMGASRKSLASQFIVESMILTLLAGALGVLLLYVTLPYFNDIFNLELTLSAAGIPFWVAMAAIVIITGITAGIYPAFVLTKFRPVKVLKNQMATGSSGTQLRKVLVTAQFVISILLIVSTIVVYQQIELIRKQDLGYQKENLLQVTLNGNLQQQYDIIKTELGQLPSVTGVSSTTGYIHAWGNNTSDVSWQGKDPETSILFQTIPTGYDFLATIGAKMKTGRDFSPAFPTDTSGFIINEKAAELMGMDNPVGKTISLWNQPGQIVGVAKNFHVGSLHSRQDPVLLYLSPQERQRMYIRLSTDADQQATLASIEAITNKHNPNYPFEYGFVDENFANMHTSDQRTGKLARIFAFLAIFISCLGLFGLAAFATEQRRREIGIRKVLGASISTIVALLSKDFILLVLIAFVIATPLAWYFMDNWLADFAYRVTLHWWVFAVAGLLALGIAFITVSFQSIKAALASPIHSLKDE